MKLYDVDVAGKSTKVELPPQDEGAVFFQIVACDAAATRCGVDTGSKRRWSGPITRRAKCGTINPTKPMRPPSATAHAAATA